MGGTFDLFTEAEWTVYPFLGVNVTFLMESFGVDKPLVEFVSQLDVYRRTVEIPQRACIFKDNCCLEVHNANLIKLALRISR